MFGIPVDCNPKVFWFNNDMLSAAGVTTNPAALFEGGSWNQAALDDLLNKVKGTGKRGMVVSSNWFDYTSFVTTFGGTAFDEESGECVWDKDEKAMATFTWLFDHFKNETITYGGSLPKGQGVGCPVLRPAAGHMPVGPLDPAEPEETEVQLRHRPDAVRGRQDHHAGSRLLRGHGGQHQGQGQAGRADVPRPLRQHGRPEVPALWRWQRGAIHRRTPRGGDRRKPARACSLFQGDRQGRVRHPAEDSLERHRGHQLESTMDKIIKGGADAKTFATQTAAYINSGGKS